MKRFKFFSTLTRLFGKAEPRSVIVDLRQSLLAKSEAGRLSVARRTAHTTPKQGLTDLFQAASGLVPNPLKSGSIGDFKHPSSAHSGHSPGFIDTHERISRS
ncbi:hypothetical protein PQR62_13275 [Herbaspirillum lusitanum]|uniref:Uncharacterized protein n=1 Tax=Herbaspirillum lusitanum TaxID=213312 RepID=A0ABW9AB78_9BURK